MLGPHIVNRGTAGTDEENYNGCYYAARFSVNRSIKLTHVGFFGPAKFEATMKLSPENEPAANKMEVKILLQIRESMSYYMAKSDEQLHVYFNERMLKAMIGPDMTDGFLLELPEAVDIPRNVIIDLRFQIFCDDRHGKPIKFHRLPSSHPVYKVIQHATGTEFSFYSSSRVVSSLGFLENQNIQ